jgi:glycosyltransferase A (GT-A) superfamily protein (DUF2064 family)
MVSLEKEGIIGVAVYTPVGSEQEFQGVLPNDFLLIPQRGELLGDRLHNAMEDLFFEGFDSVCLMGSDSPTLPPSYVGQAVEYLNRSKDGVVIGPTVDGGVLCHWTKNTLSTPVRGHRLGHGSRVRTDADACG